MTEPKGWNVGSHWLQQVTDINLVKNEVYRLEHLTQFTPEKASLSKPPRSPLQFIETFIATFCASYMAQNYDESCMTGWTNEKRKPPVVDARHLAECAWDELEKLKE